MGALVPESVKLTAEKKKRDDLVPGFDLQARAFFKIVDLGNFVPHECVG
jgi:hypothetical protein